MKFSKSEKNEATCCPIALAPRCARKCFSCHATMFKHQIRATREKRKTFVAIQAGQSGKRPLFRCSRAEERKLMDGWQCYDVQTCFLSNAGYVDSTCCHGSCHSSKQWVDRYPYERAPIKSVAVALLSSYFWSTRCMWNLRQSNFW